MTPKNENTQEKRVDFLRVYESIAAVASAIGAPESMIKKAKRDGCKAFITGNRVVTAELVRFLFGMLRSPTKIPDGFASWRELGESEKALRERTKRLREDKEVMLVTDAQAQASEAVRYYFGELERAERELPPVLAGLPEDPLKEKLHARIEEIRKGGEIFKVKCPQPNT